MLLTGIDERNREQVVLAYQRYGRGKALALPVQDTWLWRMHAKMAVEGPDAPHLLAAPGALAGRRRARSRDGHRRARPRAEGRAGHAHRARSSTRSTRASTTAASPRTSRRRPARSRTCRWTWTVEARRRVPRAVHAGRGRPLRRSSSAARTKDGKDVDARQRDGPRGAERRRVLRRRDARAAAQAHRRGNRRPVLHGRRDAARSSTRSPTAARASPSSKSESSGTCRSSCSCC